jgi:hypothetical protein
MSKDEIPCQRYDRCQMRGSREAQPPGSGSIRRSRALPLLTSLVVGMAQEEADTLRTFRGMMYSYISCQFREEW